MKNEPDKKAFENDAKMITGKKGAINFFNPWTWHRSTENRSSEWRSCILLGFVHPWMKQRFDVGSMLKNTDLSECSGQVLHLLGLSNKLPGSLDEFHKNSRSID